MTIAAANSRWKRQVIYALLVFLLAGCSGMSLDAVTETVSIPLAIETMTPRSSKTFLPTAKPRSLDQGGQLNITSPLESSHILGGEKLLIALYLTDRDNLPVDGAVVQAELRHPSGELFASLPCLEQGKGRYLSEYVRLPLQGAEGYWQIFGRATWQDGQQVAAERTFQASPSISEIYKKKYGFWTEYPQIFGLGTGFYNLHTMGGLHFEDWLNEDGSGYVILDNYRYGAIGVTFAALEVHWQHVDFPIDRAAAILFAESLAISGLHHQDPDNPLVKLSARTAVFQGRSAWHVIGQGSEYFMSEAAAKYPIEWLIFQCPGSDWLWSLVIATDNIGYLSHLRGVQKTFECPPGNPY